METKTEFLAHSVDLGKSSYCNLEGKRKPLLRNDRTSMHGFSSKKR